MSFFLVQLFLNYNHCSYFLPVCFIQQLQNWAGAPPNLYDISGSAHFINKCDNGIVIHRNRDPEAGPVDQVQVGYIFVFVLQQLFIIKIVIAVVVYHQDC